MLATYKRLLNREPLPRKFEWVLDCAMLIGPPSETPAPWNEVGKHTANAQSANKAPDFWVKCGRDFQPISVIQASGDLQSFELPQSAVGQGLASYVFKVEDGYLRRHLVVPSASQLTPGRLTVSGLARGDVIVEELHPSLVDGTPLFEQVCGKPSKYN